MALAIRTASGQWHQLWLTAPKVSTWPEAVQEDLCILLISAADWQPALTLCRNARGAGYSEGCAGAEL